MIVLKSPEEIAIMRAGGKILAQVLHELSAVVRPGITTNSLDQLARELIQQYPGATPAFLGYAPDGNKKYPAAICVSVNDEIIHGLPAERIIKEGDIVTLDLGIQYQNYFTDAAVTVAVGNVSALARTLLEATREALEIGLAEAKAGNTTGNIG
ncbi:MAG: Methionine aminopeptidase, partial [Parcubacteria group bacterium GW2011_GWA1_49_11]